MPTTWITHEGKRILYTDFRDCHSESEMEAVFEKAVQIVLTSPEPVTMNNTYSVLTGIDARAFDTEAAALAYLTSRE
jgi:hypothetical protein